MHLGDIWYCADRQSGKFLSIELLLEDQKSDPDRMEFHLSPVDYQYWTLAQDEGRSYVQLSNRFNCAQRDIRYDQAEFAPQLEAAQKAFAAKQTGLAIVSP
jgi:hypothetical protein